MKTKDQIKQEFMQDLKALLEKYDAEITAQEYVGYSRIEVYVSGVYDEAGNTIAESTEFDLGYFINKSHF